MKKGLFVVLLLASLTVFASPKQGSAFGIGGIFGDPTGLSLSFEPVIIGINYNFFNSSSYLQFHVDFWLLDRDLTGAMDWYLGIGGRVSLFSTGVGVGLRVPIGLQYFITKRFELFGEYVPGISIIPAIGYDHDWGVGFRFHI